MTAPLGGHRPLLDTSCGRLTDDGHCAEPSTVHVLWTPDMDNGVMCAEHWTECRRRWAYLDWHPVGALCTAPGTMWMDSGEHPPGYCAIQLAGEPRTAAVSAIAQRRTG